MNGEVKIPPKDFSQYLLIGLTDSHVRYRLIDNSIFDLYIYEEFQNISKPRRNSAKTGSTIVYKLGKHWSASRSVNVSIFSSYCVILVTVQHPLTKTITLVHRKQYGGSEPEVVQLLGPFEIWAWGFETCCFHWNAWNSICICNYMYSICIKFLKIPRNHQKLH